MEIQEQTKHSERIQRKIDFYFECCIELKERIINARSRSDYDVDHVNALEHSLDDLRGVRIEFEECLAMMKEAEMEISDLKSVIRDREAELNSINH